MSDEPEKFDVIAKRIDGGATRVLATERRLADAEACVKMAVYRRGVEEEFFYVARHGETEPYRE